MNPAAYQFFGAAVGDADQNPQHFQFSGTFRGVFVTRCDRDCHVTAGSGFSFRLRAGRTGIIWWGFALEVGDCVLTIDAMPGAIATDYPRVEGFFTNMQAALEQIDAPPMYHENTFSQLVPENIPQNGVSLPDNTPLVFAAAGLQAVESDVNRTPPKIAPWASAANAGVKGENVGAVALFGLKGPNIVEAAPYTAGQGYGVVVANIPHVVVDGLPVGHVIVDGLPVGHVIVDGGSLSVTSMPAVAIISAPPQSPKATYTASFRSSGSTGTAGISKSLTAGGSAHYAVIWHDATSVKTVRLVSFRVAIESVSVATALSARIFHVSGTAPATGNPAITPKPFNSGLAEAICLAAPTTIAGSQDSTPHYSTFYNLGITGAAPATNPPAPFVFTELIAAPRGDWQTEFPSLGAGTAEGFALVIASSNAATVVARAEAVFTEE